MKSIRVYLVVILVASICLVNFLAALNGYRTSILLADKVLDERLINISSALANLKKNTVVGGVFLNENAIFQVWNDNKLQIFSKNAPSQKLMGFDKGLHILNYDDVQWRINVVQAEKNKWIIYGERYDSYRKLIDKLITSSIFSIIWVLPIIALLVWWIVGYGLKPLKQLAASLLQRNEYDLIAVPFDKNPIELTQVIKSINGLFERLEKALEHEKRFSANAAHELRTPVSVLKVNLYSHIKEIKKAHLVNNVTQMKGLIKLEDSVARVEQSIEQILTLHQLTPENFRRKFTKCDLSNLAQEVILSIYDAIQFKNIDIELLGDCCDICADPNSLFIMMKNLIDNAVKYIPEYGIIRLYVKKNNSEGAIFVIEDSGEGISEQNFSKVFERFYRIFNSTNSTKVIGSGLGLSIVQHIVNLHEGSIQLSQSLSLGGLCVEVKLPSLEKHTYK